MYISHGHKVLFMPVPKSGCTTVKKLLWYMDSGFYTDKNIHGSNPTKEFKEVSDIIRDKNLDGYHKFCVVRDPVDRLISAYNHRVLMLGEIRDCEQVRNTLNLPNEPTFQQFVNRLNDYKDKSEVIKHHVQPMCDFLGEDPEIYDRIYKMSEIDTDLVPLLESKCGHELKIKTFTSSHTIKRKDLPEHMINKIKGMFKKDYELYGQYLS